MANSVINWVWDHSQAKHGARLVLLAIADRAHEDGSGWMSVADIRRRTLLGERVVQKAVIELAKMGELEVAYQEGPKGCNRYRVLMGCTPAKSAPPPQNLRGAESAPPQNLRPSESSQASAQDPAKSAPPQNLRPRKIGRPPPADSADVPLYEPHKNSSTKSSKGGAGGDDPLFGANEAKATAHQSRKPKASPGPEFERWYAIYPVHKARGDAEKAWEQTRDVRPEIDVLVAATERYRQDPQVVRGYGKYPAGWLRAKCWLDEPSAPQQLGPATNGQSGSSMRGGARQKLLSHKDAANLDPRSIV